MARTRGRRCSGWIGPRHADSPQARGSLDWRRRYAQTLRGRRPAFPDHDRLEGLTPAAGLVGIEWPATAVPLIRVAGELTGDTAIQLRHTVYTHVARKSRLVVIDLRPITALPPEGIAALVDIAYEAGDASIGLCVVAGLSGDHPVRAALREAGLYAIFDLHADPSSALDTLI
jgi:anti-anti-sigma regulatory factor